MIKFKAKEKIYYCPTSWSEITFKQWKELNNTTEDLELIRILTGIPKEIIEVISEKSIFNLSMAIRFISKPLNIEEYETPKEFIINDITIPYVKDIKEKEYGQKIYLQHSLNENKENESQLIEEAVLIYSQPFIDKTDFNIDRLIELKNSLDSLFLVDLYSIAIAYSKQLKDIIETESRELRVNPTQEQKAAGIDMFSKFGVMNTVKALAGGGYDWGLRIKEVERMEYNIAFTVMLMNKTEKKYQENYRRILEQKR